MEFSETTKSITEKQKKLNKEYNVAISQIQAKVNPFFKDKIKFDSLEPREQQIIDIMLGEENADLRLEKTLNDEKKRIRKIIEKRHVFNIERGE